MVSFASMRHGVENMVLFDWHSFLSSPSQEQIESCRKDNLLQIVEYYSIPVPKPLVKTEIKNSLR